MDTILHQNNVMSDTETEIQEREFNQKEQKLLDKFLADIKKCGALNPIKTNSQKDSIESYIWDDRQQIAKYRANSNTVYMYTIVTAEDEEAYVLEGYHFVNSLGYIMSTKKIDVPGDGIRYW